MRALTLRLALALIFTACNGGGSSPTQPGPIVILASTPTPPATEPPETSPSATPPSEPSPTTNWIVAQSFVSVDGPDNCWIREQRDRLRGAVFGNLPMTVTRSGASISLESCCFAVNYTGTLSGNEFTASGDGPLEGGGRPCADGTLFQQQPGVSNLSGRFSEDGMEMTAREVNSYRLTTGEPVTYTWDWRATLED